MAFRSRRDVQKASYYVWFLGAKELKGLREQGIIENTLTYFMEKSLLQEFIKVTLQLSRKGIKVIQGSSENYIPSSAITSSIQMDDIVACVLLLHSPMTKCPTHIHAYRCDSENTATTLHQQIQTLINSSENVKRIGDLDSELGMMNEMMGVINTKSGTCMESKNQLHEKEALLAFQSQLQYSKCHHSSSKDSDTGNSTRDSECSEENCTVSLKSRSPSHIKRLTNQTHNRNQLFDSLAAELREKLNGNGPPLLLPPRDYDTVHRSKGNLAAIELRRCRNSLIVGSNSTLKSNNLSKAVTKNVKNQVSSIDSSGIGSDLAPSPERRETISSSDDENWINERDKSNSALKNFQLDIKNCNSLIHQQLNRKNTRYLSKKVYPGEMPTISQNAYNNNIYEGAPINPNGLKIVKTESSSGEKEIKPIIMRPIDYDAKVNTILEDELPDDPYKSNIATEENAKIIQNFTKNDITNKLSHQQTKSKLNSRLNGCGSIKSHDDAASNDSLNVVDKLIEHRQFKESKGLNQKPLSSPSTHYLNEDIEKYDDSSFFIPMEHIACRNKYINCQKNNNYLKHRNVNALEIDIPKQISSKTNRNHESHQKDRNPYNEPESLPYIESIEEMMKSPIMRFKSFEPNATIPNNIMLKKPLQNKWSKDNSHHENDYELYKKTRSNIPYKEVGTFQSFNDVMQSSTNKALTRCEKEIPSNMPELKSRSPRQTKHWLNHNTVDLIDKHSVYSSEENLKKSSGKSTKETHSCQDGQKYYEPDQSHHTAYSRELLNSEFSDINYNSDKLHYRNRYENIVPVKNRLQDDSLKYDMLNLPKGYRHSYAEPIYMRNANRVGLAAVNHY